MKNILLIVSAFLVWSCAKPVNQNVKIFVQDPVRHYFPIVQGQQLDITVAVKNLGEAPLKITDIFASCGCTTVSKASAKVIGPDRTGYLLLRYDSNKNVGLVDHYIQFYGNIDPGGMREIKFDVHVVPSAAYSKDYEELYNEYKEKYGNIKTAVDGDESQKGYYVDTPE